MQTIMTVTDEDVENYVYCKKYSRLPKADALYFMIYVKLMVRHLIIIILCVINC